jgi:hypothetical protein
LPLEQRPEVVRCDRFDVFDFASWLSATQGIALLTRSILIRNLNSFSQTFQCMPTDKSSPNACEEGKKEGFCGQNLLGEMIKPQILRFLLNKSKPFKNFLFLLFIDYARICA